MTVLVRRKAVRSRARADPSTFAATRPGGTPRNLLVASLSACHQLWYLHLCAVNGIVRHRVRRRRRRLHGRDGGRRRAVRARRPSARKVTIAAGDPERAMYAARRRRAHVLHRPVGEPSRSPTKPESRSRRLKYQPRFLAPESLYVSLFARHRRKHEVLGTPPGRYASRARRARSILREAVAVVSKHGRHVQDRRRRLSCCAFSLPRDALDAAIAAQRDSAAPLGPARSASCACAWRSHTGECTERDGRLLRADGESRRPADGGRLRAADLSCRRQARPWCAKAFEGIALRDFGPSRLKDLSCTRDGLPGRRRGPASELPALRPWIRAHNLPSQLSSFVGRGAS